MSGQNKLAAGALNTLEMQVSMSLEDEDQDVLLMGLEKTRVFEANVNDHFRDMESNEEFQVCTLVVFLFLPEMYL